MSPSTAGQQERSNAGHNKHRQAWTRSDANSGIWSRDKQEYSVTERRRQTVILESRRSRTHGVFWFEERD